MRKEYFALMQDRPALFDNPSDCPLKIIMEEAEIQNEKETTVRPYPINEMLKLRESAMDLDKDKMREAVLDIQRYLLHESTKNTRAVPKSFIRASRPQSTAE